MQWGNLLDTLLLTGMAAFTIGSLALFLSVVSWIANNERFSNLFQGMIIPMFSLIGGSFIPTSNMPSFIQSIGDLTINGITLKGYMKIMQGYSLGELQSVYITLLITQIVFIAISLMIMRSREV